MHNRYFNYYIFGHQFKIPTAVRSPGQRANRRKHTRVRDRELIGGNIQESEPKLQARFETN